MTKMGIELNKYAVIHKMDKVGKFVKKLNNKTVKAWKGIKTPNL